VTRDPLSCDAMAFVDPGALDLGAMFRDTRMFDSRGAWGAAGFTVFNRANNGKIMVAHHSAAPGLLFKKYTSDVSQREQMQNFIRRREGAHRLRAFCDRQRLTRVAVPHKWILELPERFSRKDTAYILVVEQLDVTSEDQTKKMYQQIDPDVLADLCAVLHEFRGMDSNTKNLPFLSDGRVAFIDTEHWDRSTSKPYLDQVGEYMSKEHMKLAKRIFSRLDDGDDHRVGRRDFADDENTSDSSNSSDFDDEEDTSSSSS
jgi:hypothetical protein